MKTAVKITIYVLSVLLILGAIGIIFKFTNGGATDFKTFYVIANDKTYMTKGVLTLTNGENQFETRYVFSNNASSKHKGFSVKIVPNVTEKNDFSFLVDGTRHVFSQETDLTDGFSIHKTATGFVIVNNGITLEGVLQKIYNGSTITIEDNIDLDKSYFNLIVTSFDGQSVVVISLFIKIPVDSVTIEHGNILL